MNLERKLQDWEQAGLIDGPLRQRIAAHERARARPVLLYALGGLGAFTIGTGLVSIVASNWDQLGKLSKLVGDGLLGCGLAGLLLWSATTGRKWQTDVAAAVYYAFVLASVALLGQIYQTGAPLHHALLFWSLLTFPMMLLVRGRFVGLLWLAGLVTTHGMVLADWLQGLTEISSLTSVDVNNLGFFLTVASWTLYLLASRVPTFVRRRAAVAGAWSESLWMLLLIGGLALCVAFYSDLHSEDVLRWGPGAGALLLAGVQLSLPRLYPGLPPAARHGLSAGLLTVGVVMLSCASIAREDWPAVGALLQIALLGVAAFVLLQLERVRGFNALTALIALRVLVMYFEVFGSMLDTGLGMITGGALTIGLAWLWKRKSPELAARLTGPTTGRPRAD